MINLNPEIQQALSRFAYKRSIAFCYSCYKEAPSGRCLYCYSDDLIRLLPGVECEYGIDWVIKELIQERLSQVDIEAEFEEEIRQIYPETTQVGWLTLETVETIKTVDQISWHLAQSEWVDNALEEEIITAFDSGEKYYRSSEIEHLLQELDTSP